MQQDAPRQDPGGGRTLTAPIEAFAEPGLAVLIARSMGQAEDLPVGRLGGRAHVDDQDLRLEGVGEDHGSFEGLRRSGGEIGRAQDALRGQHVSAAPQLGLLWTARFSARASHRWMRATALHEQCAYRSNFSGGRRAAPADSARAGFLAQRMRECTRRILCVWRARRERWRGHEACLNEFRRGTGVADTQRRRQGTAEKRRGGSRRRRSRRGVQWRDGRHAGVADPARRVTHETPLFLG